MNLPSFSHVQEPNAIAANATLHRDLARERADNRELRNTVEELRGAVSVANARLRISDRRCLSAVAALTAGDPTAALAALTEEATA